MEHPYRRRISCVPPITGSVAYTHLDVYKRQSLNYSGTMTIENLQDYSEMMNSAEYIEWRRWAYYYKEPNKYPRVNTHLTEAPALMLWNGGDPASFVVDADMKASLYVRIYVRSSM